MTNENPIVMQNVSRSYDGPPVLRALSLSVKEGSIYGFLGRNGSGKTTALRMMAGLIKPHAGEIRILGRDELTVTLRTNSAITPENLARRWSCQHEARSLSLEDIFVELSLH